jgi:uncharacterized damage-inducible protein DinB
MDLPGYLRIQAHANRLANHRLGSAMAALQPGEWQAPRTGFFPSLAQTLNHVLAVDAYYIGAICGETGLVESWSRFEPCADVAAWRLRQAQSDARLVAVCDASDAAALQRIVELPRGDHVQRDRLAHVLAHLFNHQTHHRGQAHAMLSGSSVAPPQLDEFMMPSEAHLRHADMAALGLDEATVYEPPPARSARAL